MKELEEDGHSSGGPAADVSLRPATAEDAPLLTAWFADPRVYRAWGGRPKSIEEVLAKYTGRRAPQVECRLVVVAGHPCAFVQYVDVGAERAVDLFVVPEHQRRGVGAAAVAVLAAAAAAAGCDRLSADPDLSNEVGLRFWAAVGFRPERVVDDEPGREPYLKMVLPLLE
ncbi:MAG: GNAT family N-acetyltransferase [Actinomycetota bacterium]|nr:GNAT family N-acetyltransferase [Actinomycetota bacterium]